MITTYDGAAGVAAEEVRAAGIGRLLVTGASGLLGSNLLLDLREGPEVVAWSGGRPFRAPRATCLSVDITDRRAVDAAMRAAAPDLVLHLAALTDVDRCERDPEAAYAVNEHGAAHVAVAAAAVGARLLHVSTDAVYAGGGAMHAEDETPAPVNVYAASKLAGERAVLEAHPDALVARVTMVGFGPVAGRGMVDWALARWGAGGDTPGFCDVWFNPTFAADLGCALLRLAATGASGVVNVAGAERVSKHGFLCALAAAFGYAPERVTPATLDTAALGAPRPADTSMDCSKAAGLGVALPGLAGCVAGIRRAHDEGRAAAVRAMTEGEQA